MTHETPTKPMERTLPQVQVQEAHVAAVRTGCVVWRQVPIDHKSQETLKAALNKESVQAYWQHCAGEAKKDCEL